MRIKELEIVSELPMDDQTPITALKAIAQLKPDKMVNCLEFKIVYIAKKERYNGMDYTRIHIKGT